MWSITNPLRLGGLRCGYRSVRSSKCLIQGQFSFSSSRSLRFPNFGRLEEKSDGDVVEEVITAALRAVPRSDIPLRLKQNSEQSIAQTTTSEEADIASRVVPHLTTEDKGNQLLQRSSSEHGENLGNQREGRSLQRVFSTKGMQPTNTVFIYWMQTSRSVRLRFKDLGTAKEVREKLARGEYRILGQPLRSYHLRGGTEDACDLTLSFVPAEVSEECIRASFEEHNQPTTIQFSRRLYDHDFHLVRDAIKAKLVENGRLRGLWSKPAETLWDHHTVRASFLHASHARHVADTFKNEAIMVGQSGSARLKAHISHRATYNIPQDLYEIVEAQVDTFRKQWAPHSRFTINPVRGYVQLAVECDRYHRSIKQGLNGILANVTPHDSRHAVFLGAPPKLRPVLPEPFHMESLRLQREGWKGETMEPTTLLRHEKIMERARKRSLAEQQQNQFIQLLEERHPRRGREFRGIRRTAYTGAPVARLELELTSRTSS